MKLTTTLHKSKPRLLSKQAYIKPFLSLCILSFIATAIWTVGPSIEWKGHFPFASEQTRLYSLLALFFVWLLKLLLIDITTNNPLDKLDPKTQARIIKLQHHFKQIIKFLKKTTVSRHGKKIRLNKLPWLLLLGPENAGKTALIVNSNVHYILHQHSKAQGAGKIEPSENCRWWVTRELSILDVPGKFLTSNDTSKSRMPLKNTAPALWRFFLTLVKSLRGKRGVNGIILALPLAELMKQNDNNRYQAMLDQLSTRIQELQKTFPHPIPVFLVLTKCDLLPGFNEFFSESSQEEIAQSWGITLPPPAPNEKIHHLFAARFNVLIKRINQQLLWRIHQERNPKLRPYIKDFPLQIERLKEFSINAIKHFSSTQTRFNLQGVYLTSALQVNSELKNNLLENAVGHIQHPIQLLKEPSLSSRAYFIKQFINQALTYREPGIVKPAPDNSWKRNLAYAASITAIVMTTYLLGTDFKRGVKHTHVVQKKLSAYQIAIQRAQNPTEHLDKTLALLNALQGESTSATPNLHLAYVLSFYSRQSIQKANQVYQRALENIFVPEIKNYLGQYLENPVNKDDDLLYATLEAYLMLGHPEHAKPEYITSILQKTHFKQLDNDKAAQITRHLSLALGASWKPQSLDETVIQQTRQYLASKQGAQLAYIILKNIGGNTELSEIDLGADIGNAPALISHQIMNQIPSMYTAKAFSTITEQEAVVAANEAATGNWVLGDSVKADNSATALTTLAEQLRILYISNYVNVWEALLNNIQLSEPKNLAQTHDLMIILGGNDSPLLQLLKSIHDNTFFDPIISSSTKLQNLGILVDKNNPADTSLFQIFASLQAAHQYIQTILTSDNEKKAAFDAISNRLKGDTTDPISQLRAIADKYPDPIQSWLVKLTDYTWRFLMIDASQYIDTSWQNQVAPFYQNEVASRYPFNAASNQSIELKTFTSFFGNPGIVANFFMNYLISYIDTSKANWQWKNLGGEHLPFSNDTLQQLQYALRIDHALFPNGHSAKALKTTPNRLSTMNLDYFHFPLQLVVKG